jgi:Domain of unknown function (DUF1918)
MAFVVGTPVVAQAQSTSRGPRTGIVEEVLRGDPSPRYRVRWEDGRESVLTPANGTLQAAPRRRGAAAASTRAPARKPAAASKRAAAATKKK